MGPDMSISPGMGWHNTFGNSFQSEPYSNLGPMNGGPTFDAPSLLNSGPKRNPLNVVNPEEEEDEDDVVVELQGEHTGRWGNEEHELFLRGLELYGKGWKKIANLIKTRTVVQIRTHAQKYFQKLAKAQNGPGDPTNRGSNSSGGRSGGAGGSSKAKSGSRKAKASASAKAKQERVVGFQHQGPKTAVAPSLKPYLALPGVGGSVEVGLYKFLSPVVLVDGKAPTQLQSELAAAAEAASHKLAHMHVVECEEEKKDNNDSRHGCSAPPANPHLVSSALSSGGDPPSSMRVSARQSSRPQTVTPPEWYAHGDAMKVLLQQAETIDWTTDMGGDALPLSGAQGKAKGGRGGGKAGGGKAGGSGAAAKRRNGGGGSDEERRPTKGQKMAATAMDAPAVPLALPPNTVPPEKSSFDGLFNPLQLDNSTLSGSSLDLLASVMRDTDDIEHQDLEGLGMDHAEFETQFFASS